jgi:hypothetical protein
MRRELMEILLVKEEDIRRSVSTEQTIAAVEAAQQRGQ